MADLLIMARTELSEARARVIASQRLLAETGPPEADRPGDWSPHQELTFDLRAADNSGE